MIKPMRFITLLILIIGFSTLQAKDVLRLGMSAPLTGPSKELGIQLHQSIKWVFDQANTEERIPNKTIELIALDDQYKPELTLKNTIRFLKEDHVDALFCYVGTPTVTRVLPVIRQFKTVPLYFPFTGAQPHRQYPYVDTTYNFRASYYDETRAIVNYFINQGLKRIAVFYQIDAYGRNGWYGVKQALKAHHLSIVSEATYKRGQAFTDSYGEHAQLIQKETPDAVIIIGAYQPAAGFIRDMRKITPNIPIANISFVGAEALIHQLKDSPEIDHHLIFSHVVPNPKTSQTTAAKAFRKHVENPSFIAFEGYLIAQLFVAMQQHPHAKSYDIGLEAPITFDAHHQVQNKVYLSEHKHGQWIPLEGVTP